jgi:hypothetical protein
VCQKIKNGGGINVAELQTFKPYLAEGFKGKNIFRIAETDNNISREDIEKLFDKFPVLFHLRAASSINADNLNEPLEVYVGGAVVSIYPPKNRIIVCTTFDSWGSAEIVSKMHFDNIMDTTFPGNGQLRTCVHFDPKLFGLKYTPCKIVAEMEIDIFVYPRGKVNETKLKAPTFGKFEVRKLLELIAGGEKMLTIEQIGQWRSLITYAVRSMRSCYENQDTPEDYPIRVYYKPCWTEIDVAKDDQALANALEGLRGSIEWE